MTLSIVIKPSRGTRVPSSDEPLEKLESGCSTIQARTGTFTHYESVLRIMCMIITYNRVWINQVRLPILLVVSWTGKINFSLSPFAPKNLVSRDGLGRPVPRQRVHSPHSVRLNLVLTHGIPPYFRGGVHLFIPSPAIEPVPSLSGHAIAYRWRSLPRESTGPGPVVLRVVPVDRKPRASRDLCRRVVL